MSREFVVLKSHYHHRPLDLVYNCEFVFFLHAVTAIIINHFIAIYDMVMKIHNLIIYILNKYKHPFSFTKNTL